MLFQSLCYIIVYVVAGVMELADVVDSKSTDGNIVPVRVRPPAPTKDLKRELSSRFFTFLFSENGNK